MSIPHEELDDRILKIVQALYPTETVVPSPNETGAILIGTIMYRLYNLKADFELSDKTDKTLRDLVKRHFKSARLTPPKQISFADLKPLVRPQIVPIGYQDRMPIISRPFSEDLAIALVVNQEKSYLYVTKDHVASWSVQVDDLFDTAISNLEVASRGMQLQFFENQDVKHIALQTRDGFDASRILLPRLRQFIASRIGPYVFAIPNRDFLICWSSNASPQYFEFAKAKIKNDAISQPYPLSQNCFEPRENSFSIRCW